MYDAAIAAGLSASPWDGDIFVPNEALLSELVDIPIAASESPESGRFAKSFDAWVAYELRRAGFGDDEVWPRASRPRVLPNDLALLGLRLTPKASREHLNAWLAENSQASKVAPTEARILGRVYTKQADVLISSWARGVELLVSTKTMMSSYGNNLRNRFEESFGDAGNIRGRFPSRRWDSCSWSGETSPNRTGCSSLTC